ncbi:hypothetical protein HDE_13266 [Halotydeus destructor]|nr:hypothetical protein HDE_13266 [Halotydeus destructor]
MNVLAYYLVTIVVILHVSSSSLATVSPGTQYPMTTPVPPPGPVRQQLIGQYQKVGKMAYLVIKKFPLSNQDDAAAACVEFQGKLPEPRTAQEEQAIVSLSDFSPVGVLYGPSGTSTWDAWRWNTDNTAVKNITWAPGQPNCKDDGCETAAVAISAIGWYAIDAGKYETIVCQKNNVVPKLTN